MINLTSSAVVDLYYQQRPNIYWEVGAAILPQLKLLHDDDGYHLFECLNYGLAVERDQRMTLLGHKIKIVEGDGLRLVVESKQENH